MVHLPSRTPVGFNSVAEIPQPALPRWLFYRGRVALTAVLRGLGIGPGDEVAAQAYTCVAVPEGIMAAGATPLWIDIEPDGFNMDASSLASRIGPQTRAIVVQHTFGIPAELADLIQVAESHGIPIIEDCCHTIGSTYRGRLVGTYGVAAFNSFEWGKPIAAGLGGGAFTQDPQLASAMGAIAAGLQNPPLSRGLRLEAQYLAFRLLYRPRHYWQVKAAFQTLGRLRLAESNYHALDTAEISDEFNYAMAGRAQRRLQRRLIGESARVARRRQVVALYGRLIPPWNFTHPDLPTDEVMDLTRYPLRVTCKNELLRLAEIQGIELADWYATPIHPLTPQEAFAVGYENGQCPIAEERCSEVVSLPTHMGVSLTELRRTARFFCDIP
jgi:dTDP-4-amino-4,6-dideoxygalactose transaminase